jgi:carbamoyltransferase
MNRQLFQYHPAIGYKFISNLKTRIQHETGGYLVRTNNWGFRSEIDFNKQKDPAKKRVLVFGDSFTAGDGVSNKFRFSDVIEQSVPGIEVYNFGLPGSGTDQQFLMYQEYGRDVECDLIVLVVLVENIRRIKSHYRYYFNEAGEKVIYQKPYYELKDGALILHNNPVESQPLKLEDLPPEEHQKVDTGGRFGMARSIVNALGLKELTQKITKYQPVPEFGSADSPEWLVMREIIRSWSAMAQAKFLVVPLPLYQFVEETSDPGNYQARFSELHSGFGIEVFDPLADLLKYPMDQRRNFRHKTDVHPTPEGHKAIAASLTPKIREMLL